MVDLSVIIPAAGSGSRLGSEIPKPFLKIGDRTILEHTIDRFDKPELVREVLVPVSKNWLEKVTEMVNTEHFSVPVRFLEGGSERMYSIQNALSLLDKSSGYVAIHDAVRPFFSDKLLSRLIDTVREFGAVIPGVPVTDTIKIVDNSHIVTKTPDRSTLFAVQTPQCFRIDWIKKAYEIASGSGNFGTDDASLCEMAGFQVHVVEGERENFKITWNEDLEKARIRLTKLENR